MNDRELFGLVALGLTIFIAVFWYLFPERMYRIAAYLPGATFMMPVISAQVKEDESNDTEDSDL